MGLFCWVISVPVLFAAQRIAFFGGNVLILYVVELARNCMILLFLWTFESLKFAGIANVTCKSVFKSTGVSNGKKSALLGLRRRP